MGRHLKGGQQGLAVGSHRELLQVQLSCLLEIGKGFLDGLALRGGAGLGVKRHESAFFGGDQDGGKLHGSDLG